MRHIGFLLLGMEVFSAGAWGSSKITAIDFSGTSDPSELSIQADGPLTFNKQENAQDNQIILELKGATISKSNARKIDTSSFNSRVSLISPYQVKDQPDTVRVVIQLRGPGAADIRQDGNSIKVKIPNEGMAAPNPNDPANKAATAGDSAPGSPDAVASPAPGTDKSNLETFTENKEAKTFNGKPITIQVREGEVSDVLRLIGEASGFNMMIGDDVKGKISLSLTDVPWDQALDVVLHTLHLGAERNNNILRVVTLKSFLDEKQEQLAAEKLATASAPRVTKIFPISYAKLGDIQALLTKFASPPDSGTQLAGAVSAAARPDANTGIVEIDNRTNSLIVRDLPANIERMKKLIELLDTQTPQVMIEAKIIEASESFSNLLSGSLGVGSGGATSFLASISGGNPLDSLFGTPGVFLNGGAVSPVSSVTSGSNAVGNGTFGISPDMSFIPGVGRLNALLSWGESDSQVKIIASPKTVVINKETATILETTPVLVQGTTTVAGVGTVPAATVQNANIGLTVKPTVTNDGSVMLQLTATKDVPFGPGIGNRKIDTTVLVDSGSTLVIGGIYTSSITHSSSGIPFLRKIPIIGALFGSDTSGTDRSELFIFITPRILNPKEAGLNGNS
jgi:type IV pilus assembly protein PilQ